MLLIISGLFGTAFGHTVDSIGPYRVEIGWMNEPVVSGETNAIEFFVSPLDPNLELEDQKFKNGIEGLKKSIKMQLIYDDKSITLPLSPDHNVPGKYFVFVNPTVSGYYQANIIGNILETPISLSMHPPKVDERSYIEFPEPADITITQIIDGHTAVIEDLTNLKNSVANLEKSNQEMSIGFLGIGLGVSGIIIAAIAISKTKKN